MHQQWITTRNALKQDQQSVNKIRKMIPNVYIWLYRHDSIWLDENKPLVVQQAPVNKRVNWYERDKSVAQRIYSASDTLFAIEPPIFVSVTALAREAKYLALVEQHLTSLPRTYEALEQCAETREKYKQRCKHYRQSKRGDISGGSTF